MTNQVKFNKRELTIQGDYFDFSTLQKYTQLNRLEIYKSRITKLPELPATLTELYCSQEYFIDKYDYEINTSSIEKYRNDPITEERREINGMFNIVFK